MWFLVEKPLWEHQHSWDYFFKSGTLKSNIVLNVIWSKLVQYEAWSKSICQIDVLYTVKECRNSNLFKLRYVFVNLLLKRLEKMTKDVDKSDKCFQSWRYYRDLYAASCAKLCCSSVADFFQKSCFALASFSLYLCRFCMQFLRGWSEKTGWGVGSDIPEVTLS